MQGGRIMANRGSAIFMSKPGIPDNLEVELAPAR